MRFYDLADAHGFYNWIYMQTNKLFNQKKNFYKNNYHTRYNNIR